MNKKVFLRTFGCQMNECDSEIIVSLMLQEGYTLTSSVEEADLIIFNTCSVRKHAEDRVWGKMSELGKEIASSAASNGLIAITGRRKIIGLVGCMAKAYGKKVFERLSHVDFVCGPANIYDIPELVEKAKEGAKRVVAVDNEKRPLKKSNGSYRSEKVRSFVNISEGCNNFCSYCIVPYVRGREVSRPVDDILKEIRQLVDNGVKEVTLLGQNVNSYGHKTNFVKLLEMVNGIEGLKRIRFMTSHPKDATPELFKAIHGLDKVCEHLHLPLQSGSDKILKAMNRGYTASHYLGLIETFRKEIPDCATTADIIVGFPGETEDDFMDTYMLMEKIKFNGAFIFKYSPRPFTKAAALNDDVPKEIKEKRNQVLLNLQGKITKENNEALVGRTEEALGISRAKRIPVSSLSHSGFYIKGRTRRNSQVVYKGDKGLIGTISDVKIRDVEENTLIGELI